MDTLTLGGIAFDGFSTPSSIGGGGKQHMVIHKLPGGSRVIDTLGPDEDDITWRGEFFSNDAEDQVLALDAMRAAGQVIPLIFGGQYRSVIINHFSYKYRRRPVWIEYDISCTVYQNPANGSLAAGGLSTLNTLIGSDLSFAMGLLGL
jgi:hypothetical protein